MFHVKQFVISILGPTASGKTQMAVKLASVFNGEILSVDSRQVYRGMDLGTGKDICQYGSVPYHLIDIKDPMESFSVADFKMEARKIVRKVLSGNKMPILCGGTGFYFKALIESYEFQFPGTDSKLTHSLEKKPKKELYNLIRDLGLWEMHHWEKDSKRRMARAIEKHEKLNPHQANKSNPDLWNHLIFYLNISSEMLRKKIYTRLHQRLEEGLIAEVEGLIKEEKVRWDHLTSFGLEYKYIANFLRNDLDYEVMVQSLYFAICRYAKRQRTFIRYLQKKRHKMYPIETREQLVEIVKKHLQLHP